VHHSNRPVTASIGLGSNLGDRRAALLTALDAIEKLGGTSVLRVSDCMETEPVSPIPQPRYLNAAAIIETALPPRHLLHQLLAIERSLGRDRTKEQRWGPRTLDLDLLLYGDRIIDEPGLTIPHPRLHERAFVLTALAQIAPDLRVPTLNASIRELNDRLATSRSVGPT
jgi:2-amino-4-hydroxy-6-hydroxymethyldihydropteridine diphosphokinase